MRLFKKYIPEFEQKKVQPERILTKCKDAKFGSIGGTCDYGGLTYPAGQLCDRSFDCKNFNERYCRMVRDG